MMEIHLIGLERETNKDRRYGNSLTIWEMYDTGRHGRKVRSNCLKRIHYCSIGLLRHY